MANIANIDEAENEERMLKGELYHAFLPRLTAKRTKCHHACHRFNQAGEASRRELVKLWQEYGCFNFQFPARILSSNLCMQSNM